ncbi:hypothetical protein FW800_05155 [Pseudomonas sp. 910_23]|uniref:hypothetical protein n=1 Tax=Pseudomonas sp. 910_23 TaxID=2604461 RepID=UPI0040632D26
MTCFICGEPAIAVDVGVDYEERACQKCGHYRITCTALMLMKARDWRFDVELVRTWLEHQKSSGFIPTIDHQQASRLTHA